MHPRILAQRTADAQNRILTAAAAIASRYGVPGPARGEGRYNDVNDLMTWESVATTLEAAATASPGVKIDDVLAVPDLSKAAIKAIQKHFNVTDGEAVDPEADPISAEDQQASAKIDDPTAGAVDADDQQPADGEKPAKKAKK